MCLSFCLPGSFLLLFLCPFFETMEYFKYGSFIYIQNLELLELLLLQLQFFKIFILFICLFIF